MLEVRLLGQVELTVAGQLVEVGPPQRRAVLAALAVDAGRAVTVETLIDRVWGDQPPGLVRRALHAHITRIRRALEQAGGNREPLAQLVRRPGGYQLDIDPDRVDLHRFRLLHAQARNLERDQNTRVALLREALQLWRGEPLSGLTGQWAIRTRQGWRQQHLDAILAWADAELVTGNHPAVISPLTDLIGEHPLLEPLVATLMRALYAAGRCAEALDLYTVTRRRLIDELGTEPGSALRRVHHAILRDDLDQHHQPAAPVAPTAAKSAVPAQLPRDVRGFTGRHDQLAHLDAFLPRAGEQRTPVIISAVAGTAGVGKTALAVHWAHRMADQFPDGQLYVNLRGFHPGGQVMDPGEAIRRFLDALGVPPERIPADLDAQAALYRSQLAGRRMLIVLDNARDSVQVRPLLPGAPTCLVLVTSRNQLSGLVAADGAHPITLDLLTEDEARQLLTRRLGADRVAAEPDAVAEIISACARLPLALAIVAARAATEPLLPLHALADELRDNSGSGRLDTLHTDDPATDVRAVFSWSYQTLTPPAARLFRLLGLYPGLDTSAPAAASLAALPLPEVRGLLGELTRAHLLIEHTPGRYTFHDLLRAYATEQAHTLDPVQQRLAATHRLLDHYLHTAHTAARLLYPTRDPITLTPPQPGVITEQITDYQQALDWFITEHPVLLAAVDHAAATGFDTHTWQLAWTLDTFLDRRGHWHDRAAVQQTAVAAAERLADPTAQASAHRLLAYAHTRLGRLDDAHTELRRTLDLYVQADDLVGQAHTHHGLAMLWNRRGRLAEALHHARQALDLNRAAGHQQGQAHALNSIGWYHALLGDHQQAIAYCQQALTLFRALDDRYGQAAAWDSLGYAHHHLGQHTQAITCYQHTLELCRDLGDRYNEATGLTHLGDTHHTAGDREAARDAWQHALTILAQLDHPDAAQVRTKLAHSDQQPET